MSNHVTPEEAKLEAVAGPLKGTVFSLVQQEIDIGRDPGNLIPILDASVSRRHCTISRQEERFVLRDLDSRNSTFVNGLPVVERKLANGDEIKVGNSIFVFLRPARDAESGQSVVLEDGALAGSSTILIRKEETRYLGTLELHATPRVVRDLNALLRISAVVHSIQGIEALQEQILESVLEVAPADRAAILLTGPGAGEFTSVLGWDRRCGTAAPVPVSRTVVQRVLEEGVAVCSNDIPGDQSLGGAESLIAPRVRSVLAVPLEMFGRISGVIYLDASNPAARFDEDLLQLMAAIGSVAAIALEKAHRIGRLEDANRRLQAEADIEHSMVGESARIREIYQFIGKVARSDSTVLIRGESGTGKELVARAIHRNSPRADKPFVAINCAALTETLLESELFGHEKGAFTGAVVQKKGKLEVAERGTVFLDEIGELAPGIQVKLLRVLQEREFERVGGTRTIPLDVRLIAATNRDLEEAVRKSAFRQDLYYRLNVVAVRTPALRERREDIPLLANYFTAKYSARSRRNVAGLSSAASACLKKYDWPGNVRELENAIERAVVLGSTEWILPEDLPEALTENASPPGSPAAGYHQGVREAKKQLIVHALERTDGNYTEAARLLGLHPNYLHRLMRNLDLKGAPTSA
jgi:Nif-specific regulatory protein